MLPRFSASAMQFRAAEGTSGERRGDAASVCEGPRRSAGCEGEPREKAEHGEDADEGQVGRRDRRHLENRRVADDEPCRGYRHGDARRSGQNDARPHGLRDLLDDEQRPAEGALNATASPAPDVADWRVRASSTGLRLRRAASAPSTAPICTVGPSRPSTIPDPIARTPPMNFATSTSSALGLVVREGEDLDARTLSCSMRQRNAPQMNPTASPAMAASSMRMAISRTASSSSEGRFADDEALIGLLNPCSGARRRLTVPRRAATHTGNPSCVRPRSPRAGRSWRPRRYRRCPRG